jgi:hypothetical protein
MGIVGNLRTMQLEELLQWLSQSKKSGTLEIKTGKVEKRIYFKDGRILSSSSTKPEEYLGHFLVSHGLINEIELSKAIELQEKTRTLLGKILVTTGALRENDLHRMLRFKAEESIYDIFSWREADFRFIDDELPESAMVPMSLDVTAIVMEGVQRVDEWRRIRQLIPSQECIPVTLCELELELSKPGERRILELIDDQRTVEEIRLQTHSSEYHVCRVLFEQHRQGRLKIIRPRWIVPPSAEGAAGAAAGGQAGATAGGGAESGAAGGGGAPAAGNAPAGAAAGGSGSAGIAASGVAPQGAPGGGGAPAAAPPATVPPPPPAPQPAAGDPAATGLPSGSSLLASAREHLARKDFESALRHLRAAKSLDPENTEIQEALVAGEKKIRDEFDKDGVRMTSIPQLAITMDQLTKVKLSPQEGFMLTRINGSYDINSIVKITPMPQIDALLVFWKMAKAGHIRMKAGK